MNEELMWKDKIALNAMVALIQSKALTSIEEKAKSAYDFADVMFEERAKRYGDTRPAVQIPGTKNPDN